MPCCGRSVPPECPRHEKTCGRLRAKPPCQPDETLNLRPACGSIDAPAATNGFLAEEGSRDLALRGACIKRIADPQQQRPTPRAGGRWIRAAPQDAGPAEHNKPGERVHWRGRGYESGQLPCQMGGAFEERARDDIDAQAVRAVRHEKPLGAGQAFYRSGHRQQVRRERFAAGAGCRRGSQHEGINVPAPPDPRQRAAARRIFEPVKTETSGIRFAARYGGAVCGVAAQPFPDDERRVARRKRAIRRIGAPVRDATIGHSSAPAG